MINFFCIFLIFVFNHTFTEAHYFIEKRDNTDMTSAMTQFCIGKERENFCSDEHLTMLINFAALQGKGRPIFSRDELEIERKKEIDRQNRLKLEKEREKQKRLELRLEREKQDLLDLEKKKELELIKKMENENKMMRIILKELNDMGKNRLFFRF